MSMEWTSNYEQNERDNSAGFSLNYKYKLSNYSHVFRFYKLE